MKRRQFIFFSLASASFVVNLDLLNPKPADACFICFAAIPIASGASLMSLAFAGLTLAAFADGNQEVRPTRAWLEKRMDAQLAQREFLARQFGGGLVAANVRSDRHNYILGAYKDEYLGGNAAFAIPETAGSQPEISYFAGHSSIGMVAAAEYLRQNERMSPKEVRDAILPTYQDYASWASWSEPSGFTAYRNTASERGVLMRYDAVDHRPGGYGVINITVNARGAIKIPEIRVNFA